MKNEQPAQHTNQTQTSPPHTQSMPYHQTPQSIQQTQQTQQAQPLNAYDKFDSQYSHCHFDQQSQQHGLLNPQYNAPHNNQCELLTLSDVMYEWIMNDIFIWNEVFE